MKNKRKYKSPAEMTTIKPLKVSPLIKATRWSLLISGFVYGNVKLKSLTLIESKIRPIRKQKLLEETTERKMNLRNRDTKEIMDLAKEFEVTEFPPGWEENL